MVIRVQTRDNEPVEKALRRLRKLCNNEGLTRTSKAKAYFEKPSERRRREARERRKAIRLSMRAKSQDVGKLLNRRKKARKNARAQLRAEQERNKAEGTTEVPPTEDAAPTSPAAAAPEANAPTTAPATEAPKAEAPAETAVTKE